MTDYAISSTDYAISSTDYAILAWQVEMKILCDKKIDELREKRRLHAKHFSPDGRWAPPTRKTVRKVVDSITSPAELLHWLFVQADIVLCHETEEYLRELSVVIHGLREEVLKSTPAQNPAVENPRNV